MLESLYTGAEAIDTYKNSLITSAHHIANINTPYYKSNTLQLKDLEYGGINIASIRQNQSLSYTITSGRTLDFVIDGPGNFKLNDGGDEFLSRRGVFSLDDAGNVVDQKGRVLLEEVVEPGENISQFNISENGVFEINGEFRGKVDIYDNQGNKIADDQFRLRTGELEASDVDAAREIVNMMSTQKAIMFNFASIRTSDDLLGLIVNLVS
ncbi:MAG: hypothetical protein C0602_10340 [Denitrovibrio sp.]|nr:MAG: hypothetical protein C0602_10340 [Denitrovibrio sp.]